MINFFAAFQHIQGWPGFKSMNYLVNRDLSATVLKLLLYRMNIQYGITDRYWHTVTPFIYQGEFLLYTWSFEVRKLFSFGGVFFHGELTKHDCNVKVNGTFISTRYLNSE